ncbi:MAG: pectate lyase, partial [Oscillospiraceae bacterium]|nr:pectate lyase [Oscillospiraceae bacterium]
MKNRIRKTAAAVSAAVLLFTGTAVFPQGDAFPAPAVTVSAAEEDYPWSDYLKKSADWFGSQEALTVADNCIRQQVQGEGGWQKGMMTSHTGDWAHSTIDNDATTSQIRFLMRAYQQTKQQKYFDCAMRGVDCLFSMQYSNGGWMQVL